MYLSILIISFCLSMAIFPVARWVAYRYNVMDVPKKIRNIHTTPIPRTGGLILFTVIISVSLLSPVFMSNSKFYIAWWHLLALASIFIVGFIDDILSVKFYIRLPLQVIFAAFFVIASGMYLTRSGLSTIPHVIAIPFTIMCITGVTNAYNIIDGLNGLCAGGGLIFFALTACLSYIYNDHALVLSALLFVGCLLGFIVFNFPSAKIFLGDGGSYLIGFSVATMAIIVLKKHPEISPWALLLMAFVPVHDTLFSITRRRRKKRSPFKADKRHLHHILGRRYRSETKAVIVLWSIQAVIGAIAVFFHNNTLILISLTLLSTAFLRRLWFKRINIWGINI